ncbi:MAG TPA: hypothetical protein VF335_04245, partial [Chitinivibrionales bacterium]
TDALTVAEAQNVNAILSQKPFNGDGVVIEESMPDDASHEIFKLIIDAFGPVVDRSGKPGINAEKIEAFFTQISAYSAWMDIAQEEADRWPLGEAGKEAAEALAAVRLKIDDYFARCALVEFDGRAAGPLNAGLNDFAAIGMAPLSAKGDLIGDFPLALIESNRPLPLKKNVNPAWMERLSRFEQSVVRPLLGTRDDLSKSEWERLVSVCAPWLAWMAKKPDIKLDTLPLSNIRQWVHSDFRQTLLNLVELDTAQSGTFDALANLEKLLRFRRDLFPLCTNFVNFKDFYAKGGPAIFQMGTLYIDQRSCNLCIKVDDVNKHGLMAAMAGTYLVYCECSRGLEKMNIVAAVTGGDSDNLLIGRNGVFYDRAGYDWDATVVKIIENPISIRQSFLLPYKSFVRMIESQVAKRATAADTKSTAQLQQTAAMAANVDSGKLTTAPKKLDIGIVAALGVAAGALGTFAATLLGYAAGIIRLGPLAIAGAFVGIALLISGPAVVMAYIKLRKRSIGPILDAGGWAINATARINVPFGAALTKIAALPPGAQRDLIDPYAEKKSPWPKVIMLSVFLYGVWTVLNQFGFVNEWTGGRIGRQRAHTEKNVIIEKKTTASDVQPNQP